MAQPAIPTHRKQPVGVARKGLVEHLRHRLVMVGINIVGHAGGEFLSQILSMGAFVKIRTHCQSARPPPYRACLCLVTPEGQPVTNALAALADGLARGAGAGLAAGASWQRSVPLALTGLVAVAAAVAVDQLPQFLLMAWVCRHDAAPRLERRDGCCAPGGPSRAGPPWVFGWWQPFRMHAVPDWLPPRCGR